MKAYLNRRYRFSASHRLHSEQMSDAENQSTYGKCNNPHGHGHNYTLEVTVAGDVDSKTGMVLDIKDLKQLVEDEVLQSMDHRFLNKEVPVFSSTLPTTENIAVEIWKRLAQKLPNGKLHRIRLYETPDLYVDYFGEA